jgi:hypothetical protein
MSGGTFDYLQDRFDSVFEIINENVLTENKFDLEHSTIEKIIEGLLCIKRAQIYMTRIDWLLAGDDGEDTFKERLKENLASLDTDISDLNNSIPDDIPF